MSSLTDEELARLRLNRVEFLFQAFNLLPSATAISNVEVPLRQLGLGREERLERAANALRVVGLENVMERRPGQLSPTQRQCVGIARGLVNDPAVIFADEPSYVLDEKSTEQGMGLLQKLNSAGMTVVVSAVDPRVGNYCERVLRISGGKIARDDRVSKRSMVPESRIPGTQPSGFAKREQMVCPRCSFGNSLTDSVCRKCGFPVRLTKQEERSIEDRLGAAERQLGVESTSDEGEIRGQAIIDELKEVPVFSQMGSKSLIKVIPSRERWRYPTGSVIVKQGYDGDSFYIIKEGSVRVVLERGGKPGISLAQLGPKNVFGEMALLSCQPRSASVIAQTDVDVWRLLKAEFDRLVSDSLGLALYFGRIVSQRLAMLQERLIP